MHFFWYDSTMKNIEVLKPMLDDFTTGFRKKMKKMIQCIKFWNYHLKNIEN